MTPARKSVTLAQLRAAAPRGWILSEDRIPFTENWSVRFEENLWAWVYVKAKDRQTARRMCLAALREMAKEAK